MAAYLEPYRQQARLGTDFHVTLWATPRTQQRRFEVFSQMIDLAGKRLLDAGASRGDLVDFLLARNIAYGSYVGVDGVAEVVAFAQQRMLPRARFIAGDFVADPDLLASGDPQVTLISGSLNTMTPDVALAVLDAAWQRCDQALIFNFLSDRCAHDAPPQEDPAQRLPTMQILEWAFARTSQVVYRQDYFPRGHDGTVLMKR